MRKVRLCQETTVTVPHKVSLEFDARTRVCCAASEVPVACLFRRGSVNDYKSNTVHTLNSSSCFHNKPALFSKKHHCEKYAHFTGLALHYPTHSRSDIRSVADDPIVTFTHAVIADSHSLSQLAPINIPSSSHSRNLPFLPPCSSALRHFQTIESSTEISASQFNRTNGSLNQQWALNRKA